MDYGTQILCLTYFTAAFYNSHMNRYWDLEMNSEQGGDKYKNLYRVLEAYMVVSLTQGEEIKTV